MSATDTPSEPTCPICGNDEVETSENEVSICYNAHAWIESEESIKRIRDLEAELKQAQKKIKRLQEDLAEAEKPYAGPDWSEQQRLAKDGHDTGWGDL